MIRPQPCSFMRLTACCASASAPGDVDLERAPPCVDRQIFESRQAGDAGVVHQNIATPQLLVESAEKAGDRIGAAHVQRHSRGGVALIRDFGGDGLRRIHAQIGHDDMHPGSGKANRDRTAAPETAETRVPAPRFASI